MSWIKYKYSCYYDNKGVCHCDIPNIEVELSHNGKSIKLLGLIDSGCQTTNANSDLAQFFGVDLTKCKNIRVGGVGGSGSNGFISSLDMKFKDFGDAFNSPVVFTENLPVPLLLGQNNFFEKFDVKFEKRNSVFELKRIDIDRKSFISVLEKAISSPSTPKKSRKKALHNRKKTRPRKPLRSHNIKNRARR